jgi:hypothetical protein
VQRIRHNVLVNDVSPKLLMSIIQKIEEMASMPDILEVVIGHKHTVAQLVEALRCKSWVRFLMGRWDFYFYVIHPAVLCPWGRLSL